MLSSKFFWKLYLTFAGLVLVTLISTGFLVHEQMKTSLLSDVQVRLHDMATSLTPYAANAIEGIGPAGPTADGGYRYNPEVQREIVRIGRENATRITIVSPDGWVIADSESDPATMENHADRPEILVAQTTNDVGVAERDSVTVGDSLRYLATPVRRNGMVIGTVRTSIPLSEVDERLATMRNTIGLGAGLGILVALLVGLVIAQRITQPISQMTEVAEALRAGNYDARVEQLGEDEIGALAETINDLADELSHRIATLAEQRAQLGAMIAGLYEGVFAVDDEDRLIFNNKAARKLLLLDKATTEEPVWDLIDVHVPGLEKICAKAKKTGKRAKREVTIQREGVELIIEARANAFEGDGQRGVVVVLQDVTALRHLERMRTEFVANVSHELKTPLTSIRGYVETLIGGAIHDDANNLSFLGKINQQVDRLTAMVQDVLSLARIEAPEIQTAKKPVAWQDIIDEVVSDYRQAGKLKRHEFALAMPDHLLYVDGEVGAMTQILDNLLDNAIKYTPENGSIRVSVEESKGNVVLSVEDTGIGLSPVDADRIFERFFRTDRARSRDTGGTGLGLAIVKHLAQSLGGDVRVESELGEGTRFSVHLRRIDAEQELKAAV